MYGSNGYNCWESSMAPHPFRVNSEGNACAILAGRTTTATSASPTSSSTTCGWTTRAI